MNFLAISDVVVDEFIRLKDASVHCKINNEECEICMRWGDKIPYEDAWVVPAVGNGANAAVAAARLGLSSGLQAYVGEDQRGQDVLAQLAREKVDLTFVKKVEGKHTNHHYVLWYEDNRTILIKHEVFDFTVPPLPATAAPRWLYLTTLGENSLPFHHALVDQLKRWPQTRLAFQPGTYQLKFGPQALKEVYERADIFFCNKEEAELTLGVPAGSDMHDLLRGIKALGPKIAVITDDKRGAYAIDEAGATLHCPRYPDPRAPYEVTGAGDALASTTTAALALGESLSEALRWGSVNASEVLQEVGAQKGLLTLDQLRTRLSNTPAEFQTASY